VPEFQENISPSGLAVEDSIAPHQIKTIGGVCRWSATEYRFLHDSILYSAAFGDELKVAPRAKVEALKPISHP